MVIQTIPGTDDAVMVHFGLRHDRAGPAPAVNVPAVTFPDLTTFNGDESRQTNLIMPEPCAFIDSSLPPCSVIRPGTNSGAAESFQGVSLKNDEALMTNDEENELN